MSVITLGATWRVRGGVAIVTGFFLIGLGIVTEVVGLGVGTQLEPLVESTGIPLPAIAVPGAFALVGIAAGSLGGGAFLVVFARAELLREEKLRLDPLIYRRMNRPWKTWLRRAGPVALAVLLFVPALYEIPVAYSFREVVPVTACPVSSVVVASLPTGAELAYAWSSSDHAPVGYVELPSGPPISTIGYEQAGFVNSSFGYSYLQSDGSPISFSACDSTAPPGTNTDRTVIVTGTYYLPLL